MAPPLTRIEALFAFVGACVLALLLWPSVVVGGESFYSTDALLAHDPWRSGLDAPDTKVPHNPELGDHDLQFFPLHFELCYGDRWGRTPTWSESLGAGAPLDGNVQLARWYPFHRLAWEWARSRDRVEHDAASKPLGAESEKAASARAEQERVERRPFLLARSLSLAAVLRFVLCACFAFLWLRRCGAARVVAACGAAFVAAGPYASLWRMHTPEQVFSLWPVALFFLEGFVRRPGLRDGAGFALALATSQLGGYPQTSLFFALFCAMYAYGRAPAPERVRRVVELGAVGIVATLVCLGPWLAYSSYLSASHFADARSDGKFLPQHAMPGWGWVAGLAAILLIVAAMVSAALATRAFAGIASGLLVGSAFVLAYYAGADGQGAHLLLPTLSGHPVLGRSFLGMPVGRPFIEVAQDSIGLLYAIVIAAAASLRSRLLWLGLGTLMVAAAFSPFYALMRFALPLLEPSRAAAIVPLIIAMLLVHSVERLREMPVEVREQRLRVAAYGLLGFLVLTIAFTAARARLAPTYTDYGAALLALLVLSTPVPAKVRLLVIAGTLQLVVPFQSVQPRLDRAATYPSTELTQLLRRLRHGGLDESGKSVLGRPHDGVFVADGHATPGNTLLPYGVRLSYAFDGLEPRRYKELVSLLAFPDVLPAHAKLRPGLLTQLGTPLFDLLRARWVVARGPSPEWPEHFREIWRGENCVVAENPHCPPRVYLTTEAFDFDKKGRELLSRPLTEHVGLPANKTTPLKAPMTSVGRVGITGPLVDGERDAAHGELVVSTETDGEAYLVVLDTLLPGVEATLDGKTCEIMPAFGAFRCVRVPAGEHEVVFRYSPRGAWLARWTEALLWALLGGLLLGCVLGRSRALGKG